MLLTHDPVVVTSCQPRGGAARCEGSRAGASLESEGLAGPFSLCPQLFSEGPCLPFPWVRRVSRVARGSARGTHSVSGLRSRQGQQSCPPAASPEPLRAPLAGLLPCLKGGAWIDAETAPGLAPRQDLRSLQWGPR